MSQPSTHRHPPLPAGHTGKDGGFSILEPTPNDWERIEAQILSAQVEVARWHSAANDLAGVYDLARFGANDAIMREVRDKEAAYDRAKADARRALSADPAFERADLFPGRS